MVRVKIDEGILERMLLDRLNTLSKDGIVNDSNEYNKFANEIRKAVYGGYLNGAELDVMGMVDNLVFNSYHLTGGEK